MDYEKQDKPPGGNGKDEKGEDVHD